MENNTKNDSERSSDQVNDTDTLDDIYQHAGMNVWEIPKDVSGLQKEHPGHKRKPRPRDNRRLPPRLMPKHTALTRPPYKAPIEWSAERKRPALATSSVYLRKTTSATASASSPSSMSLSQVSTKTTASPEMTSETLETSNTSKNHAPMIHTFSLELNDTDLNATETPSGDSSANIGRELKDLQPLSFNSSIEQTNETGSTAAKFLDKEASAQTTRATVVTLVPVEGSAVAVRCPTADCMEEGARLHAFTDLAQKPCTNFYEFACSGWVRRHPYPPNRKKVSVDDVVVQLTEQKTMEFIYENVLDHATYTDPLLHNVVKIFHGCSDKSFLMRNPAMALQAALDDVRLTDWPYDEEPMDVDVPEVIAFAARKLAVHPFFAPSLETDSTTGSGWVFVFREPKAVIPEDAYIVGDVVATYQKLVTKAMSLANSDKNIQALAEPVLEVDQEVNKFDVGSFLSTLVDGIAVLDSEVEFVIPTTTFLEDVQNITFAFEKNVLLNYIGFRVVLALSPLLPHNDGRDLAHLQFAREIPTRTPAKRWRFCLRLLEGIYKLPLLQLQVDSFEKKDNFHTINRTMELLKKHLFRTVRNSSRFGQSQRQAIIAKLRDLKVQSFSSHLIGDSEVREKHYHGVPDVDPSNVLTDYVQTLNIILKNYWSYYGSMGPQFRWHGSIFDTAATYNHFENTLYIPPSLFMEDVKYNTYHSPLYFPRSGRRIMEGLYSMLEREASFFGPHNEVVKTSTWDYTTTDGYLSLRGCLKEQFRNAAMPHLVPGLTSALHPSRPLRQDVKDNAMIDVVFEAFKETMLDFGYKPGLFILPGFAETSMDQLFFLLYGTSQCEVTSQEAALADEIISASHPRRYRVNHALQNSRVFSHAFMCANNTEMNPKKKCKVW
nr:neprilysin-1-like [Dermacentor andersoni]